MVGHQWTDPSIDEPYMWTCIPSYLSMLDQVKETGDIELREAYLENMRLTYETKFPGRSTTWNSGRFATVTRDNDRKKLVRSVSVSLFCFCSKLILTFIQRFHNWLDYRAKKASGGPDTKKNEILDLEKTKKKRTPSNIQIYNRLYKHRFKQALSDAVAKHTLQATLTPDEATPEELEKRKKLADAKANEVVGVRQKFLKEAFANEDPEIRAHVMMLREDAKRGLYNLDTPTAPKEIQGVLGLQK